MLSFLNPLIVIPIKNASSRYFFLKHAKCYNIYVYIRIIKSLYLIMQGVARIKVLKSRPNKFYLLAYT